MLAMIIPLCFEPLLWDTAFYGQPAQISNCLGKTF